MTNPVSRHAVHGAGGRVLDDDAQPKRRRAIPDPHWTMEPSRWQQQFGAVEDAGVDLFAGRCDDCSREDGVRAVSEDIPVATVYLLCTSCLVADHAPARYRRAVWDRRWQAQAAEEHERKVHAAVFGRTE